MSQGILFEDFIESKEIRAKKKITKRILVKSGVSFSIINNTRNKNIVVYERNSGTQGE